MRRQWTASVGAGGSVAEAQFGGGSTAAQPGSRKSLDIAHIAHIAHIAQPKIAHICPVRHLRYPGLSSYRATLHR